MRLVSRVWRVVAGVVLLALVAAGELWALEKPSKAQLEQYKRDGTLASRVAEARALGNDQVDPALAVQLQYRLRRLQLKAQGLTDRQINEILPVLPPGIRPGLASKGTQRIFALLLDFSDYPATVPAASIEAGLFGDGAGAAPYESLRNYYRRSSYNDLEIQGATLGYYRPAYTRASIAQTYTARENLIKEALTYFDGQGHDFSQYDNNGDGTIDYFCVFWTGPDNGWANFWWGYYTSWSSSFSLDGKQFQNARYSWQWLNRTGKETTFNPLVVIHETGHSLGLPDLYDYEPGNGPNGGVGGLDMMDGNWGDHNGFSKMLLDWLTPTVTSNGQTYSLQPTGTAREAAIMWPGYSLSSPYTEFFLIQNRSRVGNDTPYPTDGLVIWHVDAQLNGYSGFAWDNSYTSHKLVRLMEADGLEQIENGGSANAGDYYVPGKQFGNATVPASLAYDGSVTTVGASNITAAAPSYSFLAGDTTPVFVTDVRSIIVPEGGTATFKVKVGPAISSTIVATVSRASGDADITVQSGSPLTFTPSNYNTWQTVTLAAAEDADNVNGTATIRISAATFPSRDVTATESDNEVAVASYDATLKAPGCAVPAPGCDSGVLLNGRDSMSGGAEPNQPNTLYSLCSDGTMGGYRSRESLERIRVLTVDGGPLRAGATVQVEVSAFVWSTNTDALDLYYTADATANPPVWTAIGTIVPTAGGLQVMTATYVLPAGRLQAVRGTFRYYGSASACATGDYDDHDDLVFATGRTAITSASAVSVPEGGTATFQVRLSSAPPADVVVSVVRQAGDADISVTGGSALTFTLSNWDTWQTVTLAAAEDADFVNGTATIVISGAGLSDATVVATEIDNDQAAFVTDVDVVSVPESGTATFNVKLSAAPSFTFTATVAKLMGDGDLTVQSGAVLSFNASNWNTWQPVMLAAAADPDAAIGAAVVRITTPGSASKDVLAKEADSYGQATVLTVSTLAGLPGVSGSVLGTGSASRFRLPYGVAVDANGQVYVSDPSECTIRRITPLGEVTLFAGSMNVCGSVDGSVGTARLANPYGIAVDSAGNVYVADGYAHTIRKVTPEGAITTIAGKAGASGSTDGVGANARFYYPYGIAVDAAGVVYVADTSNHTIRRVSPDGTVTTLAGTAGSTGSADGAGSAARFNRPYGVGVDLAGNVYVADYYNHTIRQVTPAGVVTTIAGSAGSSGSTDGTGSAARFSYPMHVAADAVGNLYVAESYLVRQIAPGAAVRTIAGSTGYADGVGRLAQFMSLSGIGVDWTGKVYAVDRSNYCVRRGTFALAPVTDLTAANVAVFESGTRTFTVKLSAPPLTTLTLTAARVSGDADVSVTGGGTLVFTAANWSTPQSITLFAAADADASNEAAVVRLSSSDTVSQDLVVTEIDTTITGDSLRVTTLAGTPYTSGSQDGTGAAARFYGAMGAAFDAGGNLYVADTYNQIIRKVTPSGVVTTLAGTAGSSGSADGTGAAARFSYPYGIAADSAGTVYVADSYNQTIRKITADGVVTTLAGTAGSMGSTDGTGSAARFYYPYGIAVGPGGTVYVADSSNQLIRAVTPSGTVTTVAGTAREAGRDDGTGSAARFNYPYGIAVDAAGVVYVADTSNHTIRRINAGGIVATLAGTAGAVGMQDGVGAAARFSSPTGVVADPATGALYVADRGNSTIRRLEPSGVVTTVAAAPGYGGSTDGTGYQARLTFAWGLAFHAPTGTIGIADYYSARTAVPGAVALTFVTSATAVTVPEGATATFQVKLRAQPTGDVAVTIGRMSGDGDITVTSGASLTFTTTTWDTYQTVTLGAAEDADVLNGTATIRVSAAGFTDKDVAATEADNDAGPIFTDDPLVVRTTRVKAAHVTELRQAVATLRARYGLVAFTWTDATIAPGTTLVKAVHLTELRTALDDVYTAAGRTLPTYSTPIISAGTTMIAAVQIAELRAAVLGIW
jgi:M6 family metalloprotease-like protein